MKKTWTYLATILWELIANLLLSAKRGRVWIYYTEMLHLKLYNINYMDEYICFEVVIK